MSTLQTTSSPTARLAVARPPSTARATGLRRLALALAGLLPTQVAVAQAVDTFFNRNVPVEAEQRMRTFVAGGHRIVCVAFPPAGGNRWSVVTDKSFFNRNVPQECHDKMVAFQNAGHRVQWVAFPPAGGNSWSVITDKSFFNRNIPQECHDKMNELHGLGQRNRCVAFPPAGGNRWTVVTDQSFFNRSVPGETHRVMRAMTRCPGGPLRMVAFDPDADGFTIVSGADPDGLPVSLSVGNESFSIDKFAQTLEQSLGGQVKFAYVVRHGSSIRSGASGPKRTVFTAPAQDFTIYDRMNPASVGKTITGVALLHALDAKNVSIDEFIYKYLPTFWTIPASIKTITFKELLQHKSGFRTGGYFYHELRDMVAAGINLADKVSEYSNLNYALARILVAYVDGYSEARVPDHGLATSLHFMTYVQEHLFDPCGIPGVEWQPDTVEPTLFFPNPPGTSTGTTYGSWNLRPGSAGLNVSIAELAIFLDRLRNTTSILSANMRSQMDTYNLGWDRSGPVKNGTYQSKGGYFPGSWNGGAELHASIMKFDTGVQAAVVVNGDLGAGGKIIEAYEAAWTLKTLQIKIATATAKLINVTTDSIDVTGENLDLVTAAHFGSATITETDSSDPTRAWIRVLSPSRMLVHTPQGLRPGAYQLSLSAGRTTSNPAPVQIEQNPTPALLMPRAVVAGKPYTALIAAGRSAAPLVWLTYSPTSVPSELPGVVSLGIGSGFTQLHLMPAPAALDPVAGCATLALPSIPEMRSMSLWFQAVCLTQTLPLPVTGLGSTSFR